MKKIMGNLDMMPGNLDYYHYAYEDYMGVFEFDNRLDNPHHIQNFTLFSSITPEFHRET